MAQGRFTENGIIFWIGPHGEDADMEDVETAEAVYDIAVIRAIDVGVPHIVKVAETPGTDPIPLFIQCLN